MNKGSILVGLLAGVAAGAILGVLLAPESGNDTRKKITQKGNDYMDDLLSGLDELVGNVKQKAENIKEEVAEKVAGKKME